MQKYELVLLLSPSLQEAKRKDTISILENEIKSWILKKDEIWLKTLAYDLGDKAWNDKAYLYSYYVQLDWKNIESIKKVLLYNKAVLRYFVYKMNSSQPYFTFEELEKKINEIISKRWDKKLWQKITFFSTPGNVKYINWKSIAMLKKYVTRFGNIKPKKYTNNTVSIQKKLRRAVLRARELGLMEYKK